ncbi:hypothetical protein JXB31_00660 [Candidatus Woesearchaeota archaeon]|nr:hypothetical protein [Candidatus Woesearchaeota archaeon]
MNKDKSKEALEKDKAVYDAYSAKYGFPRYDSVSTFLELSCLDDDGLLLMSIKKKLVEKLKQYIEIIDPIVHPDTSVTSMYEGRFFSDEEKNSIFKLYRQLMVLFRKSDLTYLDESDDVNAAFINDFFGSFGSLRKELESIIQKQKDSWEKEEITKIEDIGYLG